MKQLLSLVSFFILLSLTTKAYCQNTWTVSKQENGIIISYSKMRCEARDWILLKVENTTSVQVMVSWDDKLTSGNSEYSTVANEVFHRELSIPPNSSIEASCATPYPTKRQLAYTLKAIFPEGSTLEDVAYSAMNLIANNK